MASAPAAASSEAAAAAAPIEAATAEAPAPHKSYLIIANIAKRSNTGSLIRSAVGMGADVVAVGQRRKMASFGAKGAELHANYEFHHNLKAAVSSLKARGIKVIGIEITPDAEPIHTKRFDGPVAFLPGNEGYGIPDDQKVLCDSFVYIPQFGNGTASLNVNVATSIVMFHYAIAAGFTELPRDPLHDKFELKPPVRKTAPDEADAELRSEREAAKAEEEAELEAGISLAGLGGDDDDDEEAGSEDDC